MFRGRPRRIAEPARIASESSESDGLGYGWINGLGHFDADGAGEYAVALPN